jgi:hypothetical protein
MIVFWKYFSTAVIAIASSSQPGLAPSTFQSPIHLMSLLYGCNEEYAHNLFILIDPMEYCIGPGHMHAIEFLMARKMQSFLIMLREGILGRG